MRDKIVVGHALKNDFQALMFTPPKNMIRDTARYRPYMRRKMNGTVSDTQATSHPLPLRLSPCLYDRRINHPRISRAARSMRAETVPKVVEEPR